MNDVMIQAEHISKRYRLGAGGRNLTFREALVYSLKNAFRAVRRGRHGESSETIWALRDVSLTINKGEIVGIIGRNGAGKSTLLKILSRITEPTGGRAVLRGRVGSLLEIGTGFHSELTGRENVFLYGAILGMSKGEISRKFDEIVDFSEIEKFIDTPVKHYSSGMYMRLAFAVAAYLEPEILLVDEVLAVGDLAFQKKCLGRMSAVAGGGRTVLFVSHNMAAVEALCTRAVLLERGSIAASGKTVDVINAYLNSVKNLTSISLAERMDRSGSGKLKFVKLTLEDENGRPTDFAVSGKDASFVIDYQAQDEARNVSMSIAVYGAHGQFLLMCNNEMVGRHFESIPKTGRFRCTLPRLPFSAGAYNLNLYCEVNGIRADWVQEAYQLTVAEGDFFGTGKNPPKSHGGFLAPQKWDIMPIG